MDITIDIEDYKLNMRAAGIIIHDNNILVHKNINSDHYALVGGRVQIGEDSSQTVKREMKEELGKEVEIKRYIATAENFFNDKGQKYHEILFMYEVEFVDLNDQKIKEPMKNLEGKDYLHYEWLDLDKLDEYNILPVVVKDILKENKFPVHKINNDM